MYYINNFFFFSLFGFILESDIYKIKLSKRHSGIFYGPITEVYGFGFLMLIVLKKYFFDKLNCNKYLKLIIIFISCWISLTLIEFIGGNLLNILFDIDMWNYSNKDYNFGKYICLELSLVWGIFGTIYIYYLKEIIDKYIALIPKKISYIFIFINIVDTYMVIYNKLSLF